MPEFLRLIPAPDALTLFLRAIPNHQPVTELIDAVNSLGRVTAEDIVAPHPLPAFTRSAMDGYAVRAVDTFGASETLPAYLELVGEVMMGTPADRLNQGAQTMLIHTGGMLPEGADAVVPLEYTQRTKDAEFEILHSVAVGENIIKIGEDVRTGQVVIPAGHTIRPAEIGGMMALGITTLRVATIIKVGIISTGDEIVSPSVQPQPGQVRDVNSYSLAALVSWAGGEPVTYGIVPDDIDALKDTASKAHQDCDLVIITAGSSASARDMTAEVIQSLGAPGVLVHGVNVKPGKPTILGVCADKPVIGLPGNPVSALVISHLFVIPVIEYLSGIKTAIPRPAVQARLSTNIPSQAGREDWVAVKLREVGEIYLAEPIFSKSNLIFSLVSADGLVCVPRDATGLPGGDLVTIYLL